LDTPSYVITTYQEPWFRCCFVKWSTLQCGGDTNSGLKSDSSGKDTTQSVVRVSSRGLYCSLHDEFRIGTETNFSHHSCSRI